MKKITLLFFFVAMWASLGWAQVIIGPQNGETSNVPIASCSAYSYSQQIIHAEEINAVAGDLTSISFFYNRTTGTSTNNSNNWTVYVGHTTKTIFAHNNDWVPAASMTQVYSGAVTFPAAGNFMTITFPTPFSYNGTDNLVIAVDENKAGSDCTMYFGKTPNKTGMRALYYSNNTINPDPASPPAGIGRAVYTNYLKLGGLQESCPTPTNLTVSNLTGTTADLGWTENGTATSWNIEYGAAGFTRGTGTQVAGITSNPYTINVTIGNDYEFYVQAICSADEQSSWAGPFAFSTKYCDVSTTSSGDYLSMVKSVGAVTNVNYVATSQPTGSYSDQTAQQFHSYETQTIQIDTRYVGGANGVNIWVDWNRNMSFDANELVGSLANSDANKTFTFTVPAGTPEGTYRVRVRGQYGSSANPPACGSVNYGSTVDFNLQIVAPPTCLAPTNLALVDSSATSLTLGWTENSGATQWEIQYGPLNFALGTGTIVQATTNPFELTIDPSGEYDFYVRSICSSSDQSFWSQKLSTKYCDASATSTGDYLSAVSSSGAVTDITYTASSNPAGGYTNQTALPFRSYETQSFTMSTTYVGGTNGVNIWIDWNRNMSFDANELVASLSNSDATKTFTINVPAGTPQGTYRMRVRGQWNALPPACGSVTYGTTIDFNLELVTPPTCLVPSNITVGSIGETNATVQWTPNSNETNWNVSWGLPGFTAGGADELGSATVNGTPSYEITGLSASTQYQVYVQADCGGGDTSFWGGPKNFRTSCGVVATFPYLENFDTYGTGSDAFPDCWARPVTYTSGSTVYPSIVAANPTSAPNSLRFQSQPGIPTYAVSPAFSEDIQNMRIRFSLKREGTSSGTIDVGVMSDQTNINTFELVANINPSDNNHNEYQFNLNNVAMSGPNKYVAFRHNSGSNIWYYWLDDFRAEPIPTCMEPTDLVVNAVTDSSAQVSWTEASTSTVWEVTYGLAGFNPVTGGTTITVNTTPTATITGLQPNTAYDFYVVAVCSATDSSYRTGPGSFRTSCIPGSIPWFEGFESGYTNGAELGNCWSQESLVGTAKWTTNNSLTTYNRSPRTGAWNVYLQYSNDDWMFYPLSLTAGTAYELEFYARQDATTGVTVAAAFGTLNSAAAMTTEIIPASPVVSGNYQRFYGYFTPPTDGIYFIGIRGTLTSTPWYLSVDDIKVTEAPGCLPPGNLQIADITEDTADFSWTPISGETEWEVIYGTAGFNPVTGGTTVTVNDVPELTLTGLNSDTGYEVYVKAICSDTEQSVLAGPKYFFTGYCQFTSTSTTRYINDFFTEEGILNISNMGSGMSPGGYGNFSHMKVVSYPTGSFDFSAAFNGDGSTYGFNMWIDWNRDMEFDSNERVYGSNAYVPSAAGVITIPANTPPGNYRMRIVADWLSTNPNACGANNNAEAEDYTVTVIPMPTCMPPTDITLTSVTNDTAEVTWTPQTTETNWRVIYGETGFDPEVGGTSIEVTGTPNAMITGLVTNTRYDVYVQALCDEDDESMISGPLSFWTSCISATVPYIQDFESAIVPELPNCTEGERIGGGNMWETINYNSNGYHGKTLVYQNANTAANAWFFTQGVEMFAGVPYKISYKYGSVSISWTEKMKVSVGTSPVSAQMTTQLADHPNINQGAPMTNEVEFTVPADGVYYFGFNAYSNANQYNLHLDDIVIDFVDTCEIVTDVQAVDVTNTSATITWEASATETGGYIVDVYEAAAVPGVDTPVATEAVASGVTSVEITGLEPETSYDAYVTTICAGGNTGMSGATHFVTTLLGVDGMDAVKLTYYPNPVNDRLNISASVVIEKVFVYNLLGQKVMEVSADNSNISLEMESLSSGTYLLKVQIQNEVSTFKIVKE